MRADQKSSFASSLITIGRIWRLVRWRSDRPIVLAVAEDTIKLFRIHASYPVPTEHHRLWLVEEARGLVALRGLQVQSVRQLVRPARLAHFFYSHARLWLLLRAVASLEQAEADQFNSITSNEAHIADLSSSAANERSPHPYTQS